MILAASARKPPTELAWTVADLASRDKPGLDELAIALAMRRVSSRERHAERWVDAVATSDRRARMMLSCAIDGGDPAVAELVRKLGAEGAWAKIIEGVLGGHSCGGAFRLPT
jgi:hypothetical protein